MEAERQGMAPGWSLDLTTMDPQGRVWDFTSAEMRSVARKLIAETRPKLLIGSPERTAFSRLQKLSEHKRDPEVVRRLRVQAELHLQFCVQLHMD